MFSTKIHTMVNHVELSKKAFVPFSCLFDIIVPAHVMALTQNFSRGIYSQNNFLGIFYDFNSHLLPTDLSCDFLSGENCTALATL